MRRDEWESVSIFYIEQNDDKQTVFDTLTQHGRKSGMVIVLTGQPTKAFQSPKDFHDLKLLKRQGNLLIIFVIPKGSLSQWAIANGFAVYPLLEVLAKSTATRISPPASSSPSSPDLPSFPTPPTPQSIPVIPVAIQNDYVRHSFDPITPIPMHNEDFPFGSLSSGPLSTPSGPLSPLSGPLSTPSGPLSPPSSPLAEQAKDFSAARDLLDAHSHSQALASSPHALPIAPQQKSHLKRPSLIFVLSIVVISAAVSAGLLFSQKQSTRTPTHTPVLAGAIAGHLYFLSTGQLGQNGNNGVNDKVELTLSQLPPPASGKSYYAWLRSDANMSDGRVVLLGKLQVARNGSASLTYVDSQHTDLLALVSRFLITEEDAATLPIIPSPDQSTWRYQGIIAQIPNPNDEKHFSLLDHLRHLLAAEPSLEAHGLHGGLTLWLYRNTGKLLEWARNAQDDWGNKDATPLMRRQTIRVLDYLDGLSEVAKDVPPHTPWLVDSQQGSVGLLQISAEQDPASYMQQIGYHLSSLIDCPGVSAGQKQDAVQINVAINNVRNWLESAREDARKLIRLSNSQLQSPQAHALLNDVVTQITNAYVGTTDPATNAERYGVVWVFNNMPSLASIDVSIYKGAGGN
jgi:hypothetical protein